MVLVFSIDFIRVENNTKLDDFLKMRSCTLFGDGWSTTTNGCTMSTSKCKERDASFFTTPCLSKFFIKRRKQIIVTAS